MRVFATTPERLKVGCERSLVLRWRSGGCCSSVGRWRGFVQQGGSPVGVRLVLRSEQARVCFSLLEETFFGFLWGSCFRWWWWFFFFFFTG